MLDDVTEWSSYLEVASCFWPVVAGMAGSPVVRMDQCVGARGLPSDEFLNFVAEKWLACIPFN